MRGTPETGSTVHGGQPFYGVPLGILLLDTRFPRIPGDVGHVATWPFPVLYRVVCGVGGAEVVRDLTAMRHLEPFVEAALELERLGVSFITTSCGFLVLFQRELQQRLRIPILTSSLLQLPWLLALLPQERKVGVLTIEGKALNDEHLTAAGVTDLARVSVQGLDEAGGYFTGQILGNRTELDVERSAREHATAAKMLVERQPSVGAIVLECTNMPPYAQRIRDATGLPVYDLTTLVGWAASGIGFGSPR